MREAQVAEAYVPLSSAPGEAYQFDWSHEVVVLFGVKTIVEVAHVRLCYSRMLFVRAYPHEAQEMVFDAHDRAFAFFKGAAKVGICDNMKTAVDGIFVGKETYHRRFQAMCSHYLVEPRACTPAAGWEKGRVENQVGVVRQCFFSPRLKFKSYAKFNAYPARSLRGTRAGQRASRSEGEDCLRGVRSRACGADPIPRFLR